MAFVVLIFIFITSFCGEAYSQDTSCGIVWQSPIPLSQQRTDAFTPRIVTQGDTIHVVYESNFSYARLPYVRSINGGLDFEPVRNLITDTLKFWAPNISWIFPATNGRSLYIFFIGGTNGLGETPIYMMISSDRGDTWTEPRTITQRNAFMRSVTVLGDTICILAFVTPLRWDRIVFSTNGGDSWSVSSDSIVGGEPRIALSKNWLHLVYNIRLIEGYPLEVIYKRSSDFGMTWQDSTVLSTPDLKTSLDPVIAAQPDGRIYVAWRDAKYGCMAIGCSILFRESINDGESWSDETIINDKKYGSQAQIAIRDSTIALTWTAEMAYLNEFHAMVRRSQDNGKTWCPIYDLTPDSIGGGAPAVAISPLALHTAWVQYENPFYIIGYRHGGFLQVSVNEVTEDVPKEFSLQQCYPNPFNNSTVIKYTIKEAKEVIIKIYNVLGVEIQTLYQGKQTAGEHELRWNAEKLSTGLYFYRITAGSFMATGKALLIK